MKKLLHRLLAVSPSRKAQRFVDKRIDAAVKDWVRNGGLCRPVASIPEVADQMGVSPEQLSYHFREKVGEPFLSWRKRERIILACKMMEEHPEMPLSHIGIAVGISDKSNFKRQFQEITGVAPSIYRDLKKK